jgi:ribonuclease Y
MDHDATLAQEAGGGHAVIGGMFIKKHGEDELVVNAVAAHHDEVKQNSVYAHLVIAADALSGARPGARREVLESYVKRLEDLERISRGFPGVDKAYAVQAGREVRVMVEHTKVTDDQALLLSRDIARKIEEELTYPGQIRVTVIRETRATEVAR